jgi:hypothetical protein
MDGSSYRVYIAVPGNHVFGATEVLPGEEDNSPGEDNSRGI